MRHHERIDGRGYPMGLAGDEIPEFARVLGGRRTPSTAMTSDPLLPGARARSTEAIAELRRCSGTPVRPAFVDARSPRSSVTAGTLRFRCRRRVSR